MERSRREVWIFLFLLALQLLVNVPFIFATHGGLGGDYTTRVFCIVIVKSIVRSLVWALLLWLLCALPKSRAGQCWLKCCLLLPSCFVYLTEASVLYGYRLVFSYDFLVLLLGTNAREAGEFASNPLQYLYLGYALLSLLGAYVGARLLGQLVQKVLLKYSKIVVLSAISFVAIVLPLSEINILHNIMGLRGVYDHNMSMYDRVPWNSYCFYIESKERYEGIAQMHQLAKESYISTSKALSPMSIVVIIGETTRRDYMHCYGFPLEDTPHLDSLASTGNLVLYSDVVSPYASTVVSITRTMTFFTNDAESKTNWYNYPDLLSIASLAGYTTRWNSTQEPRGVGYTVRPLADMADSVTFVSGYDEALLPTLYRREAEESLLQVIHIMGSHANYVHRVPDAWRRFTAQDVPIKRSPDKDSKVASYINTVYYNDYVVSKIMEHYSSDDAIVFYFSDHGEIIYDDPSRPDFCDHGLSPQGVRIPFMVYCSPSVRSKYPELYRQIVDAKDRRIMNDLFTHSLTALIGIQTTYSNPSLEFFSADYNSQRPRTIRSSGQELSL